MRNEYKISIFFNNRFFSKVIIDQHYKVSHPEITDELILKLIRNIIDDVDPEATRELFDYYKLEPVINAFRVRRTNGISKSKRD